LNTGYDSKGIFRDNSERTWAVIGNEHVGVKLQNTLESGDMTTQRNHGLLPEVVALAERFGNFYVLDLPAFGGGLE